MAFIHLIYFYIVLLLFLINPQEVKLYLFDSVAPENPDIASSYSSSTSTAASPSISAVLLECPIPTVRRRASDSTASESPRDCERQMMVHIRVSPSFQVDTLDKFLLLDEVFDRRRKTRAKLMSPYLIEISRGEPIVMYPLQFSKSIRCNTCGGTHKSENTTETSLKGCPQSSSPRRRTTSSQTFSVFNENSGIAGTFAGMHQKVQEPEKKTEEVAKEQGHALNQKQPFNTIASAQPMGNDHPAEKVKTGQKLAIGILDPSPFADGGFNDRDFEVVEDRNRFSSEDLQLVDDYDDLDEYDDLILSNDVDACADDTAADAAAVAEEMGPARNPQVRGKRVKTRPQFEQQAAVCPTGTNEVVVVGNPNSFRNRAEEERFRQAERAGEQARLETLKAFTRKHYAQPVKFGQARNIGNVDGYGATRNWQSFDSEDGFADDASGNGNEVAGSGDGSADRGADSSAGNGASSGADSGNAIGASSAAKSAPDSGNGSGASNGAASDEKAKQNSQLKLKDYLHQKQMQDAHLQLKNLLHKNQNEKRRYGKPVGDKQSTGHMFVPPTWVPPTISNAHGHEGNTFLSSKSLPGSSHRSSKKESQPKRVEHLLANFGVAPKNRKFQYGVEDVQRPDSNGDNDDELDIDEGEDFEDLPSSVHGGAGGDRQSMETAAGGMGDEFYWNTLHYPGSKLHQKPSSGNRDPEYRLAKKTINNAKVNTGSTGGTNTNKKAFGGDVSQRSKTGTARTAHSSKKNSFDNKAKRNRFAIKSARSTASDARVKQRNLDEAKLFSGGYTSNAGVVESSGLYNSKGSVIPHFPLNEYPGYSAIKTDPVYTKPGGSKMLYQHLEDANQAYLPKLPPFAKQLADPNLTVADKIDLLEVLSDRDHSKDDVLQNNIDSSNNERVPGNSPRLTPGRSKKKTLKKRSFLTYDDLTMRDTDEMYDDLDMKQPLDAPLLEDPQISDTGPGPGHTCSGHKCPLSHEGEVCHCDRQGRHCECRPKSSKKIRSVSDAWYSVFNMSAPLQFLTTSVTIYRKRHGAWWKTAPSITLTSLSGIYASENLSILFSSHVDIFQLRYPPYLQNNQLLVPQPPPDENGPAQPDANGPAQPAPLADDGVPVNPQNLYEFINPRDILAIDTSKYDLNKIEFDDDYFDSTNNKEEDDSPAKRSLCEAASLVSQRQRKRRFGANAEDIGVVSVADLGYFPDDINILQKCPNDQKHLCLSLLDEESPAFTIKIKQPFLENALFYKGEYKIRIITIVSDATTKGALQVGVIVVNEDYVASEFTICIADCPMTCGARTTVKKELIPHMGETVSFLLPLQSTNSKFDCKVDVKSPDQKVIASRKFKIKPKRRCLCVWNCECHCIDDLMSYDEYNVCRKINSNDGQRAGFIEGGIPPQELTGWRLFFWQMNCYAFSLLLFILFLGLLKGVFGLCLPPVDRFGYNYVQPLKKYDSASRCRRFCINTVFFAVLPFVCCCKCFVPTEEDLLLADTEWQCSLIQHTFYDDSSGDGSGSAGGGSANGKWKKPLGLYGQTANEMDDDDDDDEETILRLSHNYDTSRLTTEEYGAGSREKLSMSEHVLSTYDYDEGEEERDRNFVLQALTQSRESLKTLLNSHHSEDLDIANPMTARADELVRKLIGAHIVYRTFDVPLEDVDVPVGQKYSIQGYFVPSLGPGYQFIPPNPLFQTINRWSVTTLIPTRMTPFVLRSEIFQRSYHDKMDVMEAGDLSVTPPFDAPCINCSNTLNEHRLSAPTLQ